VGGSNGKSVEAAAASGAASQAAGSVTQPRPAVEPDLPPTRKLLLQVATLGVILAGSLLALWQFFLAATTAEIYRKELSVPNRELEEVMARDEGRLTQYDLIDEKKGLYQIPVRRAMEMLVADPSLLAAVEVQR
jgi:hypothetical protein